MDEELTTAYRDLVDSAAPPPDAGQLVAARRTQRRRRRQAGLGIGAAAGVSAVAVVAALILSNGGSDVEPAPDVPPSPAAVPDSVTCPGGTQPQGIDIDHVGYDSFTEMLRTESASNGPFVVDRARETIYFLRSDGSAHSAITWTGDSGSRWFPGSMQLCQDRQEWSGEALDIAGPPTPLALPLGHCWIEPVEFGDRTWDVMDEDQFGWGEGTPARFTGAGTAWQTGDVVSYLDAGGARLTLVPEGDSWTTERGGCD